MLDDHAQIGYRCLISAKNYIHIERDVVIAQSVAIIDHGYAHADVGPVTPREGWYWGRSNSHRPRFLDRPGSGDHLYGGRIGVGS